jgi:hypothetical protein
MFFSREVIGISVLVRLLISKDDTRYTYLVTLFWL